MTKPYLYIERDGALLEAGLPPGPDSPEALRLRSDCMYALRRFRDSGYGLVLLVDTPPGGSAADPASTAMATFFEALFASQGAGFESVRRCRHAPDANCDCALPGIGLVAADIANQALDRARSAVIGGDSRCLALARAMGLDGYVVDAGYGWTELAHAVLDKPRRARVVRRTRETDIEVEVDLDLAGEPEIATGIGFFDHMLEQLGKHGGFALRVSCNGDLEVDEHHTVEDVGLAVGQALREALGDKRGIGRYGFLLPMDEAEAQVAIDLSGRAFAVFEGEFPRESVGGLPTELVGHFFRSLSETLGAAVHITVRGENAHHMVEGCFKGVARALRQAFRRAGSDLPSTKGTL